VSGSSGEGKYGRSLPPEARLRGGPYGRADFVRRRQVLRETINVLERAEPAGHYHRLAQRNLERWASEATPVGTGPSVRVISGDWGEVTHRLTKEFGTTFAVLNMANAYVPGGAYVEGAPAQEENMFRRTDCHFTIDTGEMDPVTERYHPHVSALLNGQDRRVFLDTARPRVCIRGPEDRERPDLGYPWLREDEIFPFYELRAAALDLRGGRPFDWDQAHARIAAQLDTLVAADVRHAVLSAFGCGAFQNPADAVAQIYRDEIETRRDKFDRIAFAIFHPGYGPDNYSVFKAILEP